MIIECKKKKIETNMRSSKRCVNGLFLYRKTTVEGFIAKQKSSLILWLQWVLVFKKRNLVQACTVTTSTHTRKTHGQYMCI